MKKIPTLFVRRFEGHKIVEVTPEITPGCEEAFLMGKATVKVDGSCCAIIDDIFYKRYDAKNGKKPPEGAIPCCDPDSVTGHWPHWVKVDPNDPGDKWFWSARCNSSNGIQMENGTYEAIGKHFRDNPYGMDTDILVRHGANEIFVKRDYDSIKEWLTRQPHIEGIVFWLNDEPVCKIKRTDFGLPWPVKENSNETVD